MKTDDSEPIMPVLLDILGHPSTPHEPDLAHEKKLWEAATLARELPPELRRETGG